MSPQQNPGASAALVTGFAMLAVPAIVATPILGALGFGATGIAAGSAAAGIQSGVGSVVAPSLFATLQSAGAGGYGVAAVHGVVQATGAAVAALGWFGGQGDGDNGDDHDEGSNGEAQVSEKEENAGDENEDKRAAQ
ncbi:hypothetical protein F53441_7856 [Fusarium austroafricanum]|uniref:Uncharacterized protein n=1 Tax=Fusarium austroafricanum TaxID=2364996 RepID=A0A8H4KCN9_9HYPO|nr:hypothetical protein F53441_7856 [Fusarium austroafricanum]